MKDNLRMVLKHFVDFKEQELDVILKCFKAKSVSKNTTLLYQGSICKEFYFINKGCLRTFFIDKNGREKTRYVMLENHVGTAFTSFIFQQASFEFLEAVDDSQVLYINHSDFYRLNKEIKNWSYFYQHLLELAYSFQNKKIEQLVTLTAKQRYDLVLNENPILIQRLSNKLLASYLDIREETLSRLKSK